MKILTYNRIHVNSIDLSEKGRLVSGGIGFMLKSFPIQVTVKSNNQKKNKVIGYPVRRTRSLIKNIFEILNLPSQGFNISVEQKFRNHLGLGSTTQIEAAITKGILYNVKKISQLNSIYPKLDIGMQSSIGLNLFLNKGLIIDFGYRRKLGNEILAQKIPVKGFLKFNLNKNWKVIVIVRDKQNFSSKSNEEIFWRKTLPVKKIESREIAYHILMGLVPAIKENNFDEFIIALDKITQYGTKKFEIKYQDDQTKNMLKLLHSEFGFGGLSSLGPTCYTFYNGIISKKKIAYLQNVDQDYKIYTSDIAGN